MSDLKIGDSVYWYGPSGKEHGQVTDIYRSSTHLPAEGEDSDTSEAVLIAKEDGSKIMKMVKDVQALKDNTFF